MMRNSEQSPIPAMIATLLMNSNGRFDATGSPSAA